MRVCGAAAFSDSLPVELRVLRLDYIRTWSFVGSEFATAALNREYLIGCSTCLTVNERCYLRRAEGEGNELSEDVSPPCKELEEEGLEETSFPPLPDMSA